ncbi:MAG: AsmA family protein [Gemmatimonadota bacterium]|nr:MAG: AsmA family protein [Gemmatimonadota bacterium]
MKKRYILLIGLVTLLILLMAVAVALLKTLFTSEELTARIVPKMEAVLKREVEIDGIGLTVFLWGVGVKVEGVRIANTEEFGSEPLAGLDEFLLKVKLWPLLRRRLEVTKILLVKPDINLRVSLSGRSNVDDLLLLFDFKQDKAFIIPLAISLPLLEMKDGRIRYMNEKSHVSALVDHIDHWMNFEADRSFQNVISRGKITFGEIGFSAPGMTKRPIQGLFTNVEYEVVLNAVDEKAELEYVKFELPFLALNLRGEISNINAIPAFNIILKSDQLNLENVLNSLPQDIHPLLKTLDLSGWAQLEADISGDTAVPKITGRFLTRDVKVSHPDISQPIVITTDIDFTENALNLRNFQAGVGGNSVRLNVHLADFNDPTLNARAESDFNLEEIGELYPLPPGIVLSGKVSSEVNVRGKISKAQEMHIDGQANVAKTVISLPRVAKPWENIQGKIKFSQNSVDDLNMSLSWGQSDLSLSGKVTDLRTLLVGSGKRPRASLFLTSNLLDLDEILPPPVKSEVRDGEKTGQPPLVPLPDIGAELYFQGKSVRWKTMDMTGVSLKLKLKERLATLEELKADVHGGTLNLNGHIDLTNAETPVFLVKTRIDNVEANTFVSRFSSFGRHLFGKLTTGITFEGKGGDIETVKRSLTGSGGIAISEGTLKNWTVLQSLSRWAQLQGLEEMRFKNWQGSFFILNQRVKTEDLKIHGENADWSVSGSTGFDGSLDYTVDALLSPSLSQKVSTGSLGNLVSLLKDEQGRVNLMFRVSGKPSKPKFEWDTESAQEKAKQRLASEAEKLKQEVEGKIQEEKTKLEEEAKKKADELKRKAEEERKKKEEELKKKAQETLKKLLKPGP